MTRDPCIDAPAGRDALHDRRAAFHCALVAALVAASMLLVVLTVAERLRSPALHPLDDLLLALPVALAATAAFWFGWPHALRQAASAGWHRANGLLVLPIAVLAITFFVVDPGRVAWTGGAGSTIALLAVAATAGGAVRWVLAMAQAEANAARPSRGDHRPERVVTAGLAGFVVLLLALGGARNTESFQRMVALGPESALLEAAGRQRMLALDLGRAASLDPVSAVSARDAAARELAEAGQALDRAMGSLPAHLARFAGELAPAAATQATARTALLAAAGAGPSQVRARVDAAVAGSEALLAALRRASAASGAAFERSALVGLLLLALAAAASGGGMARAIARVLRAQRAAIQFAADDQSRLAAVLRTTARVVIMTDVEGRITWANPAFERLSGYALHEALGRSPGSLLQCADTDPATVARVRAAIAAVQPVRVEILNSDRAGNRYWIDLLIEPQFDAAGRHAGFMAIETDITETVLLRERHRAFFESMAAGVVVQDATGAVVACNAAACRMLGLDADQLLGRRSVDPRWGAIREDGSELPGDQHFAMRTLRSGEPFEGAVMGIRTPQGERRWLAVSTRLVPGASVGCHDVLATFVDITERKRSAQLLAGERERMVAALDATRAGVWHWRIDDGVVETDARWAQIMDQPPGSGGRLRIGDWMRRLHPDDAELAVAAADMHLHGITDSYDAELRVRHRDGRWAWVHCRGRLTASVEEGQARSMFGTLVDISARKAASFAAESEQHKLRSLFEMAPIGVALARGEDGALLECNGTLCRVLGRQPGALVGRRLREFAPADEMQAWDAQLAAFQQAGSVGPCEKSFLRADGTRVPVLVSARRVPLPDGGSAVWTIVQDITERKALEEGLQQEARTDKLTGLANRVALLERLEAAVAQSRADARAGFGVLFLDFDRFKLVNDTLGHEAGDELLRQIADRLRGGLRTARGDAASGTFVARIGGDEFVVLVGGTSDVVEIERVARRLLGALAAPYAIRGADVQSSASIGMVSSAQCELDTSAILRDADTAMYEAKRRGRGVAVMFDEGMRSRLRRQVEVERNLRRAIAQGELAVLYQPIIDLESGEVSSVEALLRWNGAELGEVSPSEFIPIAEDSGQIVDIGAWVLEQACRAFARWCAAHPDSPATVSVNLSRVQLGQPDQLLATVERALDASGLPPARLQLEVTERDVMRDPAAVLLLMRHLRAIGVRLAMDDFGTGTSSLACLRDYPFDVIKIDRGFVGDLGSNGQVLALVHATMMLIENLGMTSVAEGVETTAQAAILQSVGCRLAQGWLFGPPVALGEVPLRVGGDA